MPKGELILFENSLIRRCYDQDRWFFSIADVYSVLSDSINPRKYWSTLRTRIEKSGVEFVCRRFKIKAVDGSMRADFDSLNLTIFNIIKYIPSAKADPFKDWVSKIRYEGVQ
jgi:hypothetical protein